MNWFSGIVNLITSFIAARLSGAGTPVYDGNNLSAVGNENITPVAVNTTGFNDSRIIQDYSVTQKWHTGWKRPLEQITEVVIHHTDGTGNIDTLKKWMFTGERKNDYAAGISLFHFAVDRDGEIWKSGPLSRWWYHSCSGRHDRFTVGIENIHKSGAFTEEQYGNLFWLLFDYMPHFCPSYYRIVSHDYNYNRYSNMKKGCPGPDFDWGKLEDEMNRRGIAFETHDREEYTLKFPG